MPIPPAEATGGEPYAQTGSVGPMRPITHIRSATISSSILSLQSRGLHEAYVSKLRPSDHEGISSAKDGQWTPIALAVAHYRALDELRLGPSMTEAMGAAVSARLQGGGGFLGTIVRATKSAGVTPWALCSQYPRLWDRLFIGGGIVVRKAGPKDAVFESHHLALADIPYFRQAYMALHRAGLELFARRVVVQEVAGSSARCFSIRAGWV